MHYPKGLKRIFHVSYGLLNKINNGNLSHYCSTEEGSSGSPIQSLENNKVIGIHRGFRKKENYEFNIGIFIKIALDRFYSKCHINDEFKENNKWGEKIIKNKK